MSCVTKEYVIENFFNGYSYGLYIKRLLVFLKKISKNNCFTQDEFDNKIKRVQIGPSDEPFKKFDYLQDLIKMGCLIYEGKCIRIVDYIDEIPDDLPVFEMKIVDVVRVRFSNNLESKGVCYKCDLNVSVGDRVRVDGSKADKIGVVTEINVNNSYLTGLKNIISIVTD